MEDILGTVLKVGDTVATTESNYSDLQVGKVERFTPKMIKVRYGPRSSKLCTSSQVIFVEEDVAIVYWLKKG